MKKVILVSIDGMRPDAATGCGNPFVGEMMKLGSYALDAQTIFPSVTLPCHMSMFHSVPAERHGITTNIFTPMVRPLNGLMEQIKLNGGVCAMYYGWEQLRDIARPGALKYSSYMHCLIEDDVDRKITDMAIEGIERVKPDFVFLYMPETDDKGGHAKGWMTETYMGCVSNALSQVKRVYEKFGGEYTIIVTADHGGHDRAHGTDMPEDMTIPMFFIGEDFIPGRAIPGASILDIAPTVATVMGIPFDPDWEGEYVNNK